MTKRGSQLAEIVERIIDIRRVQTRINTSWIATEAMKEIDPANRSPALVRLDSPDFPAPTDRAREVPKPVRR